MPILDQFDLRGKRALVTGGSRGLGLEMARALAEAGAEVVLSASDPGRRDAAVRELRAAGLLAHGALAYLATPEAAERSCRPRGGNPAKPCV